MNRIRELDATVRLSLSDLAGKAVDKLEQGRSHVLVPQDMREGLLVLGILMLRLAREVEALKGEGAK
jgi:hypothetical protein